MKTRRTVLKLVAVGFVLLVLCFAAVRVSSHHSLTIDVLGSYFPAWMVCIVSGLTLTLVAHWIVQVCHLKPYLGPAPLIYSCSDDHLHVRDLDSVLPKLTCTNQPGLQTKKSQALLPQRRSCRTTQVHSQDRQSVIIVAGAVVITLYVWGIIERHPRTDDATARANVVGIAPRVAWSNPQAECAGQPGGKRRRRAFRNRPGGLQTHPGKG